MTGVRRLVIATLLGVSVHFVAASPALALCPNCLGQAPSLAATLKVVGTFLLVPPAIFFAVTIAIRRLARRDPDERAG
jgi:hypothetical protein